MTLAFIVLAHRSPEQVALLLSTLRHPAARLYLHVDTVADLARFQGALSAAGLGEVVLLPRFRSRWGGVEVVDATVCGIKRATADGCTHFVLLSGQDLPLWPVDRIVSFFAQRPDRSYMESFPLPDPRWAYDGRIRTDFYTYTILGRRETCIPTGVPAAMSRKGRVLNTVLRVRGILKPRRRFPAYARPFGGAQWWNLSRAAVEFVLGFLNEHPDYRSYHENTLLPDELFFQSILMGTEFASRFEVVNSSLRFMIWPAGTSHPRTLALDDLPGIKASGMPFARKFEPEDARAVSGAILALR